MTVTAYPDRVPAGEPFRLEVDVRWQGGPERYVLYPPKLELPDTVHRQGVRQSYFTEGTETVYRYEFTLTAEGTGSIGLGEVSVDYRDMQAEQDDQEPVKEAGPGITVLPGGSRGWLGRWIVPGVAFVLVAAILFWRRRRVSRPEATTRIEPAPVTPETLIDQARHALTNGQTDRTWALLIELKPRLPAAQDPLPAVEQLEAERLRARYGGVQGSQTELERLLRAVERVFKAHMA